MNWKGFQRFFNLSIPKTKTAYSLINAKVVKFIENGAGTYTGAVSIPAGSFLVDVIVHAEALWDAATSASMDVGDAADPNGIFTAINLKATDLLAGEGISFSATGGQEGADVTAPGAAVEIRRRYLSTVRTISGVITSVGAGTAGRTWMVVLYATPETNDIVTVTQ